MSRRAIPRTNELLPVVGCGTWIGFDAAPGSDTYPRLPLVLQSLAEAGGSVVDTSPMYGRAESVIGEILAAQPDLRQRLFLATKVWTSGRDAGIAQMQKSFERMNVRTMDLLQVHNLVDWRTHWQSLHRWQSEGRIRYAGLTHYTSSAYGELEAAIKEVRPAFVQLNYSIDDRAAEERLLPLAADLGIAVIVNMPFGGGGLLRSLSRVPLPGWANEVGCASWSCVLLKFVLSHPAVTCVIPGTSRPEHMQQNAAAGAGVMPDARQREQMVRDWRAR